MAFVAGYVGRFQLGANDVSAYLKSVKFPQDAETKDVTVFGNQAKAFIPGLRDGKITLEGFFDPTFDGIIQPLVATQVTFTYGPQGTAVGSVKYTGNGIVTKYDLDEGVEGPVTVSIDLQCTGPITRGTF